MLMWIWIAVVVVALIILGVAGARLLGRLDGLRRAAARLRLRQEQALKLQRDAEQMQQTLLAVQQQTELIQEHAVLKRG